MSAHPCESHEGKTELSSRLAKLLARVDSCVEQNQLAIEKIEAGIARRGKSKKDDALAAKRRKDK